MYFSDDPSQGLSVAKLATMTRDPRLIFCFRAWEFFYRVNIQRNQGTGAKDDVLGEI